MFDFDGRLSDPDIAIISASMSQNTVVALDDFEGIEKGVLHALSLKETIFRDHILILPPNGTGLRLW